MPPKVSSSSLLTTAHTSLHPRDEGMLQCFIRRAPFLRVQIQTPVQQIDEQVQLFELRLVHVFRVTHKSGLQVPCWFDEIKYADNILANRKLMA